MLEGALLGRREGLALNLPPGLVIFPFRSLADSATAFIEKPVPPRRHYVIRGWDSVWQSAAGDLQDLMQQAHPKDARNAPKDLAAWCRLYVNWLTCLGKLTQAFDQLICPALRLTAMSRFLEVSYGQALVIREALVQASGGQYLNFAPALIALKKTPDVCELPLMPALLEAKEAAERQHMISAALEDSKTLASAAAATRPLAADIADPQTDRNTLQPKKSPRAPQEELKSEGSDTPSTTQLETQGTANPPKADTFPKPPANALDPPGKVTREEAAVKIQAVIRGCLSRKRTAQERQQELLFLGMVPKGAAAVARDSQAALQRKKRQAAEQGRFEIRKQQVFGALRSEKGLQLKQAAQDKISAWFLEQRPEEAENFPELPSVEEEGSDAIPTAPQQPEAVQRGRNGGEPLPASKGPGTNTGAAASAKTAPQSVRGGNSGKGKQAAPRLEVAQTFLADFQAGAAELNTKRLPFAEDPEEVARLEENLLRAELLPLLELETRLQADEEMRGLLSSLRAKLAAEKLAIRAKAPKAAKGKGGEEGKPDKKGSPSKTAPAEKQLEKRPKSPKAESGKKASKKSIDPTASWSTEALLKELCTSNILQPTASRALEEWVAAPEMLPEPSSKLPAVAKGKSESASKGAPGRGAETLQKPARLSRWQIKQAVVAHCIIPLGSSYLYSKVPHAKTLLLYGPSGCGKTLLARIIASSYQATWFNLSPRNTDGRYTAQDASLMLKMVFKAAKLLAPSVIYIEEVEKVFILDKKRQATFGGSEPFSRIRKDLIKEAAALTEDDRVLIVGHSREPQACVKADQLAFTEFFKERYLLPSLDYTSRREIWKVLLDANGVQLKLETELSALAKLSEGWMPGDFAAALDTALHQRSERSKTSIVDDCITLLGSMPKVALDDLKTLEAWPPEIDPAELEKKGKK